MNFDELSRRELLERAAFEPRDTGSQAAAFRELKRSNRWEETWEWRISTYGTERLERLGTGFRAGAEFNGRSRVDVATLEEAWEALRFLAKLGTSLFYALGWDISETTPSLETEPDRGATEAYLKRLARELPSVPTADEMSRGGFRMTRENRLTIDVGPPPADWGPPSEWYEPPLQVWFVRVSHESVVLECECTTPERARLFLGVFDALISDLLEVPGWNPLPATD